MVYKNEVKKVIFEILYSRIQNEFYCIMKMFKKSFKV